MPGVLHNATLAELPAHSLAVLAALRGVPGLRVLVAGDRAWVRWDGADPAVVQALLPAAQARFFERRDGHWFACGSALPAFDLPAGDFAPLHSMLLPGRLERQAVESAALLRANFTILRDDQPRECTALICTPGALAQWAAMAPDAEIAQFTACRSGELVLVVGNRPPLLAGCERFWGSRFLLPMGWRANPDLPEQALCEAAGATATELVLWRSGAILIPGDCLAPLSRASARMGARNVP
ncbi:MAG: hypothetical protein IPP14_02630 [Planctomycetes bacterium]|nr:hypothetical protein [Planctomycetota bacterium]